MSLSMDESGTSDEDNDQENEYVLPDGTKVQASPLARVFRVFVVIIVVCFVLPVMRFCFFETLNGDIIIYTEWRRCVFP